MRRPILLLLGVGVVALLLIIDPVALAQLGYRCASGGCGVRPVWLAAAAAAIALLLAVRAAWRAPPEPPPPPRRKPAAKKPTAQGPRKTARKPAGARRPRKAS
jgi:hypothetical protein